MNLKGKMAIFGGFFKKESGKNQTFFCGIWATDAREVWGKFWMCATYSPEARKPSNHSD